EFLPIPIVENASRTSDRLPSRTLLPYGSQGSSSNRFLCSMTLSAHSGIGSWRIEGIPSLRNLRIASQERCSPSCDGSGLDSKYAIISAWKQRRYFLVCG